MSSHLSALHPLLEHPTPHSTANLIELVLTIPIVLWAGSFFFTRGCRSLVNLRLKMLSLIGFGVGTAYLYSIVATFAPGIFPTGFHTAGGMVETYFEPAAVITVLVILGQALELRAQNQTGAAIRALLDLAPKLARRLRDSVPDEENPLNEVMAGDRLRIHPGDAIPVDGVVLEGRSSVDELMLSGEAMPLAKKEGDNLIGGAVNRTGAFVM